MKHSRNDVNHTFMRLLTESLLSPVSSPERIVIEHAMLISILHANVGTEIGGIYAIHCLNFKKLMHPIFVLIFSYKDSNAEVTFN